MNKQGTFASIEDIVIYKVPINEDMNQATRICKCKKEEDAKRLAKLLNQVLEVYVKSNEQTKT